MNWLAKAKQKIAEFKAAKEYVDAIMDLPPTYKNEAEINGFCPDLGKGGLGMKQIFPDPVSEETIKRKLARANEAERKWKECCAKNNIK